MPDFTDTVVKTDDFLNYCQSLGFAPNRVAHSQQPISRDVTEKLQIEAVVEKGLIDPQFADAMPKDGTVIKTVLPLTLMEGSVFVYVYAPPNTVVKNHSHTKGFLRFVALGDYIFTGLPEGEIRLTAGDWIYIPPGQTYGYRTGPRGGGGGCCYCTRPPPR